MSRLIFAQVGTGQEVRPWTWCGWRSGRSWWSARSSAGSLPRCRWFGRPGVGAIKGDIQNAVHLSRKSAPRLDLLNLRKT